MDVLIVGAGPAGIAAARPLQAAGATVLLVDSRARIGDPPRCGELARGSFFEALGFEPPVSWIRRRLRELSDMPVIDRTATESGAAKILAERGAMVREGCALVGLGEYDGQGRSAQLRIGNTLHQTYAKLVLAADGAASRVARLAGIDTCLSPLEAVSCLAHRVVDCTFANADNIRFEFPPVLNPHYFWVIPSGPHEANVGLGVPAHRGHALAPLLDRLTAESSAILGGRVVQTLVGWYPSTLPLESPYTDGLLVVGTAARLIDAELGEGLFQAAFSGRAAAHAYLQTGGKSSTATDLAIYRQLIEPLYEPLRHGWEKRRRRERRQQSESQTTSPANP